MPWRMELQVRPLLQKRRLEEEGTQTTAAALLHSGGGRHAGAAALIRVMLQVLLYLAKDLDIK